MNFRFPIYVAACFLACFAMRASAAEPASAPSAWRLLPESIGKLPEGWTATRGTWTVRADSNAEVFKPVVGLDWTGVCDDQLGRALTLALPRDSGGGAIETTDRAIEDFDVTFRWKFYAERGYWADEFRFRIQERDRKQGYALTRERNGKISLSVATSAKERVVLQSSARAFAQQQGEWLWMRVNATGKRFRVSVSADGGEWTPAIDATDPQSNYSRGALGFAVQSSTIIALETTPENRSSGAKLDTISQSRVFRTDDARVNHYRLDLAIRSSSSDRAAMSLAVTGATEPVNVALSHLRAGINHYSVWVPVPATGRDTPIEVALRSGDETIDRASVRVTDVLGRAQFKPGSAANHVPTTQPQSSPISRQTYLDLVQRIHTKYGAVGGRFGWDSRWGDAALLYRATHDEKYLDNTLAWVRRWLDDRAKGVADFPSQNFAQRYGFAIACEVALESGKLNASEQASLRALIADFIVHEQTEAGGVLNRTLGYVLAYPVLLRCVPDFPLRREVTTYIDRFKQDVNTYAEGLENSTNYLPITVMFFVRWIDQEQPELWKDARVREGFENVLQLITPGGDIPMFGDYGGPQRHTFLLVAALERLAVVYHDGRFKWAAQTVARRCLEDFDLEKVNGWDSQALAFAVSWTDETIAPQAPTSGSVLLKRTDGHLDKLVLRSGWRPDDRQAMIDLLNGYEHGDNGALSVVSISRGARQSLLDKAGRGIGFHSLPRVNDRADDLPYPKSPVDLGAWRYACFDLPLYWSWGNFSGGIGSPMMHQFSYSQGLLPYDFTYDPAREFAFGINILGSSNHATLSIDDVKLVKRGPTPDRPAAQRVLEDFDGEPTQWIGDGERSDRGGRAGRGRFGRFHVNFDNGGWVGRKFPMPLDINASAWDQIEFWYKLDSDAGDAARLAPWCLTIGDRLGYPHNYLFHHSPSFPVTLKALHDTPLATFASLKLDERDDQGRPQTRERQIVFVKRNGVLWVRDVITLQGDEDRGAWAAGPVWQLAQLGPKRGPNWVDTWVNDNVLIWCLPKSGRKHALVHHPFDSIWGHGVQGDWPLSFHQVAEGRGPVKEGELIFDSVLIPHENSADASAIAASIHIVRDEGGVTALEIDGDWLIANRTGSQVTTGNVKSDHRWTYVQRDRQGKSQASAGEGGTGIACE